MRVWTTLLLLIAALSIFGLYSALAPSSPPSGTSRSTGKALIGGPFEAVDHLGAPITQESLKGHYSLLYFGFTHCPDICPTGLLKIANALNAMGDASEQVTPYFVSVDPERDTPEILAKYVTHFHPRLVGITGSVEQIDAIAKEYKVYFQKMEGDTALGYLVDHSGFMYLMDPKGEYVAHFAHNASELEIQTGIENAMGDL